MATTFDAAIARRPLSTFQMLTVAICMLVLVCDGMDLQLLGIVAPLVMEDFGVERGTFGIAMGAALIGFGFGAWGGGWLGDTLGKRYTIAIAAVAFSLATIGAGSAGDVWEMALWRLASGLGFGAAYPNAVATASEWVPPRWRPVTVSTLSVGTPIGGTIVGWIGPGMAADYGWDGTFVRLGMFTMLLVIVVLALLRDSPPFLLAKGKREAALAGARRAIGEDVDLVAGEDHGDTADGSQIGVFHRSNTRFNFGVGIAFAASALCAYGILSWTTTFLTTAGFTLPVAGNAVAVAGITSMIASVAVGAIIRRFGSQRVMALISGALVLVMALLAVVMETIPAQPSANDQLLVTVLIGLSGIFFSGAMAGMYVIMALGYPLSCRSTGIGFGILMSRVGAVGATSLGGALLEFGGTSTIPYFTVLAISAALISAAAFVVDRHVTPLGAQSAP